MRTHYPIPAGHQRVEEFDSLLTALRDKRPHATLAAAVAHTLAEENVSLDSKADFLRSLHEGLWTEVIVAEFARVFRKLAIDPHVEKWADRAIDVCGTGGDHSESYKVSTTAAFILAASGIPVLKHGNRSVTSKCGSADFLERIGIPIEVPGEVWHQALDVLNFAFFFAPVYHPAFRYVNPARKILGAEGKRTIFNLLGPILNPGRPAYQLVGTFSANSVKLIRNALIRLNIHRALVVSCRLSGHQTLDELSVAGVNSVLRADRGAKWGACWTYKNAGLKPGILSELRGGDVDYNLRLLKSLTDGHASAGLEGTVTFNAGAALWVAGKVDNLKSGVTEARDLLTKGPVRVWLQRARTFFADHGLAPTTAP